MKQKTYKAPTIMGYCPRCKTKTLSEHIDYPDDYERDEICAVCGAVKSRQKLKDETPAMVKVAGVLQLVSAVALIIALIAMWFVEGKGLPVGLVATTIGASCQIGCMILYRNVPKEYSGADERRNH